MHLVHTDRLRRGGFAKLIRTESSGGREGKGLDLRPTAARRQIESIDAAVARRGKDLGHGGRGPEIDWECRIMQPRTDVRDGPDEHGYARDSELGSAIDRP